MSPKPPASKERAFEDEPASPDGPPSTPSRDQLHAKAIPPFAALRAFEAVGRHGGIRKAALALSLDHAVISRHLKMLERWLGAPLLDRTSRRLRMTEAGRRYHDRVTQAMIELASATQDIVRQDGSRLQVWCVPGFAAQWVADQLAEFELAHPKVSVELRPTDTRADLAMYEADVDIRFYGDDWPPAAKGPGLKFAELARPPILAVASPRLAAELSGLPGVAELMRAPLLHEEHDRQWRAWLLANGVTVEADLPGPLMWHAHLALAAARRGRGVALASRYLVARDLERGDLVEVCLPGAGRPVLGAYAFVARGDRWETSAIAALRDFLMMRAVS